MTRNSARKYGWPVIQGFWEMSKNGRATEGLDIAIEGESYDSSANNAGFYL